MLTLYRTGPGQKFSAAQGVFAFPPGRGQSWTCDGLPASARLAHHSAREQWPTAWRGIKAPCCLAIVAEEPDCEAQSTSPPSAATDCLGLLSRRCPPNSFSLQVHSVLSQFYAFRQAELIITGSQWSTMFWHTHWHTHKFTLHWLQNLFLFLNDIVFSSLVSLRLV